MEEDLDWLKVLQITGFVKWFDLVPRERKRTPTTEHGDRFHTYGWVCLSRKFYFELVTRVKQIGFLKSSLFYEKEQYYTLFVCLF